MTVAAAGPVALVTGAARRIGRAISLEMAAAGVAVAAHYRSSPTEAAAVVRAIVDSGGRAQAFAADLSTAPGARGLARAVLACWGRVDVLVNNASIFVSTSLDSDSADDVDDALRRAFGIHVAAPLALVHELAPAMRAVGRGAVVNVGDACRRRADHAPYLASKAALESLTRTLARDLAPEIRVNMVAPGSILPPAATTADATAGLVPRIPAGRLGAVDEVARVVRFLALGPEFVSGQIVAVDGAQYA